MSILPDLLNMPWLNDSALNNSMVVDKEATRRNQQLTRLGMTAEEVERLKAIAAQQQTQQNQSRLHSNLSLKILGSERMLMLTSCTSTSTN